MPQSSRDFAITLFGATGFTGGLCAHYLAQHLPPDTAWAIAGRSEQKLEAISAELREAGYGCLPRIMVADAGQLATLTAVAQRSKVVISTVGPYVHYGEPLVRACVQAGTHYCDLTGEPEFVHNLIADYHVEAERQGCAIVNSCGFDSIPHDAGALFTLRALQQAVGGEITGPVEMIGMVTAAARFSGGTWHSALTAFGRPGPNREAAQRARQVLNHAYPRRAGSLPMRPRRDGESRQWLMPLPTIDPMVVRRSARALTDFGPDFRYGHFAAADSLPRLLGGSAGVAALVLGAQIKPLRKRLLAMHEPGQGPSESQRAKSWFKVRFRAQGMGKEVVCEVAGGDPGYSETAKMLAETAMSLALDPGMPHRTGVVTPVMALEDRLIERLQAADMRFTCLSAAAA